MYKEHLLKLRYLRHTKGKITQCPDALGEPLSSLTVVPKSVRHHGVNLR